jgi:transposase
MASQVGSHDASWWAAITAIAAKIGCTPETLRRWVRQQERDTGQRPGPTTAEGERVMVLERAVREPSRANAILHLASAFLARRSSAATLSREGFYQPIPPCLRRRADVQGDADRPVRHWRHVEQRNPALRCARSQRDDRLNIEIERVWQANLEVYRADKVWRQLRPLRQTMTCNCAVKRSRPDAHLPAYTKAGAIQTP